MEKTIVLALLGLAALIVLTFPIHLAIIAIKWIKAYRNPPQKLPTLLPAILHSLFAIMIIIIIPNFLQLSAKAKQSEAKTNLGAIYTAQIAYFSRTNTYAAGDQAFQIVKWEPWGQNRYAYYCDSAVILNLLGRAEIPMPNKNWPVETKPASSQTGFTCMVVGNDDIDETLDVWSINDGKILRNDLNDINNKINRPHFWEKWTK